MTRQKAEQQNKGDLEGRGTVERFQGRFVVDVQTADSLYNELYLSNKKKEQTNKKAREKKSEKQKVCNQPCWD